MTIEYKIGVWHGWNGGECPVNGNTRGDLIYPTGYEYNDVSLGLYDWSQTLLFRIVTPYVEPEPKLECWVVAHEDGYVSGSYRSEGLAAEAQRIFGGKVVRMIEADE